MTVINVLQYSNGRTVYGSGTTPYPPTNPKTGPVTGGNTVYWNQSNHTSKITYPRQGGVDITTWSQADSLNDPVQPRTKAPLPYLAAYKNPSTDKYGRSGVTLGGSNQGTATNRSVISVYLAQNISRYTTDSGIKSCPQPPSASKAGSGK